MALPVRSVVLDGEGVICGRDGRPEFDSMRACSSRAGAPQAFLYAFDVLELDGRDLRIEPWARRREALMSLLADVDDGIRLASTSRVMAQSYSERLAVSGSKGSSQSGSTAAIARAGAGSGSRSRTRRIRRSSGLC